MITPVLAANLQQDAAYIMRSFSHRDSAGQFEVFTTEWKNLGRYHLTQEEANATGLQSVTAFDVFNATNGNMGR